MDGDRPRYVADRDPTAPGGSRRCDRDQVVSELGTALGVTVCFEDPGIAEFGLHNALMTVGDQFLEVVSPVSEGTTAGRLLDKRGGDGGYMAIFEVDDLDAPVERLAGIGVRVVWHIDLDDIRARHLHPRDVGGAIVSLDEPRPNGAWRWAGPWRAHAETSVVTAIAGVDVGAVDPDAMGARWADLGLDHAVRFVPGRRARRGHRRRRPRRRRPSPRR